MQLGNMHARVGMYSACVTLPWLNICKEKTLDFELHAHIIHLLPQKRGFSPRVYKTGRVIWGLWIL